MHRLPKVLLSGLSAIALVLVVCVVAATFSYADDIHITGSVPPKPSDVDFTIVGAPTTDSVLHESDTITVTIRYRSHLTADENFRIQGFWEKGTLQGSPGNYVDAFEYVVGSATDSDDGTVPTVDLLNRRITWEIAALPSSATYHTVSFSLRVPGTLATLLPINATVSAQGQIISTLLPVQSLTYSIQGIIQPTSTPTPTPTLVPTEVPGAHTVTSTPAPTATTTPSPSPASEPFTINTVQIRSVSDSRIAVSFATSIKTTYEITYGPATNPLSNKIRGSVPLNTHEATLENLIPGTDYVFRIAATNAAGTTIRSDLFSISTVQSSEVIPITKDNVSIMWQQIQVSQSQINTIILPNQEPITASIHIANPRSVSYILMRFQNRHVLGIANETNLPAVEEVRLLEVVPGTFSGELAAPRIIGEYQLLLEIHLINGGITTQVIPYNIIVSPNLKVTDSSSGRGIESALVAIERYIQGQNQYVSLDQSFAINNETDEEGYLPLVLSEGRYRLSISAPGYKPTVKIINLGHGDNTYPVIKLVSSFAFIDRVNYYTSAVVHTSNFIVQSLDNFFSSNIAQEATFAMLNMAVIVLATMILSARMNISILGILYFPLSLSIRLLLKTSKKYYTITVLEHGTFGKRITGATILAVSRNGKLLWKKISDPRGCAHVPKQLLTEDSFPIKLFVHRTGYYAYPMIAGKDILEEKMLTVSMEQEKTDVRSLAAFLRWFARTTKFIISDMLMVLTITLVFFFTYFHGVLQALPMLIATAILVFVWGVYVVHRFEHEASELIQ